MMRSIEDKDVSITGIAGRFPDCDNIDQLRDGLFEGRDMVSEEGSRWKPGLLGLPKRGGLIKEINKFDHQFFGIHNDHVNDMDPQVRIFLEVAFEAIMD